jgi:signal transduction histidine kinase
MQQSEEIGTEVVTTDIPKSTWDGVERRRVERVVETLATSRGRGESISEIAHDARNMVTALGLYCDLLEEPCVLASAFTHYAHELRLVAAASRRLVEKLVMLDANTSADGGAQALLRANADRRNALSSADATSANTRAEENAAGLALADSGPSLATEIISQNRKQNERNQDEQGREVRTREDRNRRWDLLPALPITNLAAEVLANRNLLSALAGPSIVVTMEAGGGAQAVRLSGEDLTRLLVNLVKNAAEAMPKAKTQAKSHGCRVHIVLGERETAPGAAPCLALTVEDNGPGIPEAFLDRIFTSGYTTRGKDSEINGDTAPGDSWPQNHRGLGLAIVRSIVEGAGGRITASNRSPNGACFTLELPVRKTG